MEYRNSHCRRRALRLMVIQDTPHASLLKDPFAERYYIDYADGTDEVYLLDDPEDFKGEVKYINKRNAVADYLKSMSEYERGCFFDSVAEYAVETDVTFGDKTIRRILL